MVSVFRVNGISSQTNFLLRLEVFSVDLIRVGYSLSCSDEDGSTEHLPCDPRWDSTLKEVMKRKRGVMCCFASTSYIFDGISKACEVSEFDSCYPE